jgi:predicted PP-loop superfamily ATPase
MAGQPNGIEALRQEIRLLVQSESTAKAIESLRQEIRDSNEEYRRLHELVEARLRGVELALAKHRVRARIVSAACGVGASAATHVLSKWMVH